MTSGKGEIKLKNKIDIGIYNNSSGNMPMIKNIHIWFDFNLSFINMKYFINS